MADFDKGGTVRQLKRVFLGPSVGWVETPDPGILNITATGTYNVDLGITLINVNIAGAVTINLPKAAASGAGAQAIPRSFIGHSITVVDQGGNSVAFPITIVPGDGTIDGLASVRLASNFGSLTLVPNTPNTGYTV